MIVKVSSLTAGAALPVEELEIVKEACNLIISLEEAKRTIVEFVESRMSAVAPNLTALVGSSVAAKMMSLAGGLTALSKMSPATIEVLGSTRKNTGGFSNTMLRVNGFLAESEFVTKTPADLRRKAVKLMAGKVSLAARVDSFHEDPSGEIGKHLLEDIGGKIGKILEPPPLLDDKALPAPDDRPRKRRGGRRYISFFILINVFSRMRKIKQKYEMTELRKQQNRVPFGLEAQEEIGLSGKTMGSLGLAGGGKVRIAAVDKGILRKNKKISGSSGICCIPFVF